MIDPVLISRGPGDGVPAISIILPVYNGGAYLKLSLESVLAQTFQDFELLIIDDCSRDGSFEYLQSIKDGRISLFKNRQNRGLFCNINFLIRHTNSSLIKLWAQDDIMYPQCLSNFVSFHQQYPHLGFSYSGRDIINENGEVKSDSLVDETPTIIPTILHTRIAYYTGSIAGNIANVCINKSALDEVGFFNERMKISGDFDMWVRLARHHDTGFIREKLIQLRDHHKQLSRNEEFYLNHVREDLQVYRYLDSYVSAQEKKRGRSVMRGHKLVFYYTLMIKAVYKGKLTVAASFLKALAGYDNFLKITLSFITCKFLSKQRKPDLFGEK